MTASLKEKSNLFSSLFSGVFPDKKITKPIRLIEFFGGVGAQARALENLEVPFEHWRLVEWSDKSCAQYNAIHQRDFKDYSEGKTREEMEARVLGVSLDYNSPLPEEKLSKRPLQWLKNLYNAAVATNNLFDITKVKGSDLGITEEDKYEYVLTYSFPCQDLSNAGKMAGMSKGDSTRSGMLWEVERILTELADSGSPLPQTLLMENVPGLIGEKFLGDFSSWANKLESLGYRNYIKILDASDFGIPQSRRRVFMVSLLGDYSYDFPSPIKLNHCLKDFLESKVEDSYYLTEGQIERILAWKSRTNPLEGIEKEKSICPSLLAKGEKSLKDGQGIYLDDRDGQGFHPVGGVSHTLKTQPNHTEVVLVGTSNGHQSGNCCHSEGLSPTLAAHIHGNDDTSVLIGSAPMVYDERNRKVREGSLIGSLTTRQANNGYKQLIIDESKEDKINYLVDLSIRKLTEGEYCRLMGFTDEDCAAFKRIGMSNSTIYHSMGDSIVVTVLMAIFGKMIISDDEAIRLIKNSIERTRGVEK